MIICYITFLCYIFVSDHIDEYRGSSYSIVTINAAPNYRICYYNILFLINNPDIGVKQTGKKDRVVLKNIKGVFYIQYRKRSRAR